MENTNTDARKAAEEKLKYREESYFNDTEMYVYSNGAGATKISMAVAGSEKKSNGVVEKTAWLFDNHYKAVTVPCCKLSEFAQSRPATLYKESRDEVQKKAIKYANETYNWPKNKKGEPFKLPPGQTTPPGYKRHIKLMSSLYEKVFWDFFFSKSLSEQPEAEKQLKITCPDCNGTGYEGGTVRLRGGSDCKTCKAFGKIDAPKPTESEQVEKLKAALETIKNFDSRKGFGMKQVAAEALNSLKQ